MQIKNVLLPFLILAITACVANSSDTGTKNNAAGIEAPGKLLPGVKSTCAGFASFSDGNKKYENNIWGADNSLPFEQCLISKKVNDRLIHGWTWHWLGKAPNWVFSYPEIIVGWKPWGASTSTDPAFPVKISEIEQLTMSFDIESEISGSYNLAPEIWIVSEKPKTMPMASPEQLISTEIMFWMDHSDDVRPAGKNVTSFEFDGHLYDLWIKADHNNSGDSVSWSIFSLVSREKQLHGEIDIIGLINKLIDLGYKIDSSEYIATVEFGNETHGPHSQSETRGTTWINQFDVALITK